MRATRPLIAMTWGLGLAGLVACASTFGGVTFVPAPDAPAVAGRPDGCHVEVYEEGQHVPVQHAVLGHIVVERTRDQMKREADGAYSALKAAACERGAFLIRNVRALPRGMEGGFVYEGDLAVLVDASGRPVGLATAGDAGPAGVASSP